MSTGFEQFQNMPKEPKLGNQEELLADNEAFQAENAAATQEGTQELKKSVMESLYGIKKPENEKNGSNGLNIEEGDGNDIEENQTEHGSIEDLSSDYSRQLKLDSQKALGENAYLLIETQSTDRLASINNDGNEEADVKQELGKTEIQEQNREQAKELIYNEGFISQFYGEAPEEKEYGSEFFNNPEVQQDLDKILENFYLPTLEENISNLSEKEAVQVNIVLNASYDIQISKLLDGKVNYPQKTVERYINDIHEGNPFEKIALYQELKQLVHNGEGISGKAMEKGKKDITASIQRKLLIKTERQRDELVALIIANQEGKHEMQSIKEEVIQLEKIIDSIKSGEVLTGGEMDVIEEGNIGENKEQV